MGILSTQWVGKHDGHAVVVSRNEISRGFKIDYNGRIGDMLARTAKDVGAKKTVFKHAEFFTFCSARLSRKAIESDPRVTDVPSTKGTL